MPVYSTWTNAQTNSLLNVGLLCKSKFQLFPLLFLSNNKNSAMDIQLDIQS